ncbi:transposable element Tcb1 transposase [Trichonephila clavipes]|nr:transposable element Tcb1 transposase [Trichonephila clavipes]
MRVSMTSRKRMEGSERWHAVGRIEAGQSITDVALFFGVHHSVISRLWKQIQTPETVVQRPVGGQPRPDDKRIRIWRKQRTRNQPENIIEHHTFQGGCIMVWAGISLGYRTDLHIFKRGSVTALRYRDEVLKHIVRLYAAAVGPTFVLMDNNARPHRADIVVDYLESEGIARMAWSVYSPDLNPIENLWGSLGRAVSSRFPIPANLIELETALQEECRLFNAAVVDHLIESMVRRCKLCIQMRLDHIPN